MGDRTDAMSGHDRTDEIRRDIERTQREMSRTIDEIQHRLSPHYMMEQTKQTMKEASVNTSRRLVDKIRENPIPAAMVGVGLFLMLRDSDSSGRYDVEFIPEGAGWDVTGTEYSAIGEYRDLDYGDRGRVADARDRVSGAAEHARERVSEATDTARERVSGAMSSAKHATSDAMGTASERARRLAHQARIRASRARYQSRDLLQENPLIAGVAAIALGALIGAMIPESEKEHELMGETRDRLAHRAKDAAREGVDRAKNVATAAAQGAKEAAKDEARSQSQAQARKTDIGENVGLGTPQI